MSCLVLLRKRETGQREGSNPFSRVMNERIIFETYDVVRNNPTHMNSLRGSTGDLCPVWVSFFFYSHLEICCSTV